MAIGALTSEAELRRFVEDLTGPLALKVQQLQGEVLVGDGDPTGVVDAEVGTLWRRTDGGAGSTLYVKEGPTLADWAAK